MSQFQSNTLFGSIIIAVLWQYFCGSILDIDTYVGVLGALSSITLGLWIGWNQKSMGFVGGILSICTALSFLFSIIPVYNHKPTLDVFYATQVPSIVCDNTLQGTIDVNTITVSMNDICKRGRFPILIEQQLKSNISGGTILNLGMGNSIIIYKGFVGILKRTDNNGQQQYTMEVKQEGEKPSQSGLQTSKQIDIRQAYQQDKKEYLQKNFPWVWEYAPTMTKIALRKMSLLGLIDRSYNDKISSLEFYLQEIQ